MRRALAVFAGLALAACQRPSVPALAVPAAPVLDAVDGVQHRRLFSLRGVAATEVTVRLFADSASAARPPTEIDRQASSASAARSNQASDGPLLCGVVVIVCALL